MQMKVLFVAGGNTKNNNVPSLIVAQGNSLINLGVNVDYFPLIGKGIKGYLKNILKLRKFVKENQIDIIHAHFSFSGVVASLARTKKPIVVSLLGTDVNGLSIIAKFILKSIRFLSWDILIVKSEEMSNKLKYINTYIIPNGVDLDLFYPQDSDTCKKKLNWDTEKKHILFAANPQRFEKNFCLTQKAIGLINEIHIEIHHLDNVEHDNIPIWLNASDVIVLSSLWEGSPNVIKEAMACNRPIVATNVGDIAWLFGNEIGHYISDFTPEDFGNKTELAINFSQKYFKTNARERIIELGLDSSTIAKEIIDIYKKIKQR